MMKINAGLITPLYPQILRDSHVMYGWLSVGHYVVVSINSRKLVTEAHAETQECNWGIFLTQGAHASSLSHDARCTPCATRIFKLESFIYFMLRNCYEPKMGKNWFWWSDLKWISCWKQLSCFQRSTVKIFFSRSLWETVGWITQWNF